MEDDGETYYRVTVPRLPGLIAYGDDLEEGMAELEEAKKSMVFILSSTQCKNS